MDKICLIIIFNHKYNKNIPILEKIYKNRFSNRYYIVPFNTESIEGIDEQHIISVYETSYCFQGYLAQAYKNLKDKKYSHYLIIGDDLILNPALNEDNIVNKLNLDKNTSYIKNIIPFGQSKGWQSNKLYNILSGFRINIGVSYKNEIPSYDEALKKCKQHNLKVIEKLPFSFFRCRGYLHPKYILLTIFTLAMNKGRKLPYPLFKAYSDLIIINQDSMNEFCRLSGVFAAMNIFAETAIPVAMILACSEIKTEGKINGYYGVEKWGREEIAIFEEKYKWSLDDLFKNFGDKVLYYHPVKLSKWKYEEI